MNEKDKKIKANLVKENKKMWEDLDKKEVLEF
jgi:hypothetical protein